MGLTTKQEERIKRMPLVESFLTKSKNGKYIIQRTVITNIKPAVYYKAILEDQKDGNAELQQFFLRQGEELLD